MPRIERSLLIGCLRILLRPVCRFCIKYSLKIQDILECLKVVFLEMAKEHIEAKDEKVTDSRLSVMTGIHRKDVTRLMYTGPDFDTSKDLITKVVGQWLTGEDYTTSKKKPRVLSLGPDSEFNRLVGSVSKELNPATVLFELQRVGAVNVAGNSVKLEMSSYIPQGDMLAGFNILANDNQDLLCSVEENVIEGCNPPNLHLRTQYDKIRPHALSSIRMWFLKEGNLFHARARAFLSKFDQDITPDPNFKDRGTRVVLSSFSRIEGGGGKGKE